MANVLPLSILSAFKIKEVNKSTKAEQALISVLNAFEQWRKNKKRMLNRSLMNCAHKFLH